MPDEDQKERVDRELIELLHELRVAITGIQVLFAFLLTVAFSQRFPSVTTFQRDVYFVTLLCAAIATAFLIAPSAQHRLLFRQHDKEALLRRSNGLAITGLAFGALAITGAIMLITDLLFGTTAVVVVTAATAALFLLLWYVMPLVRRSRSGD